MSLFREEVSEFRRMRLHGDIVLTPAMSVHLGSLALAVIMAALGVWLFLGQYARVETVPGLLVTTPTSAKIFAAAPGVLNQLRVKEGAEVHEGDVLAIINLDRRRRAGTGVAAASLRSLATRKHLGEEQIGLSVQRDKAERRRLANAASSLASQAQGVRQSISLQEKIVASNSAMVEQITGVVARGFVSKIEMERRRQALISSEQSLAGLRQQLMEKESQLSSTQSQLANLSIETASRLSDLHASLEALSEQQAQMEGEEAYVIAAPIAGRVTAIQTGVGRGVGANIPLMIIVPMNAALHAEIYAPSRAIGFVRTGQEARLLFDAFPYQKFGSFLGRVSSISKIVIDPRESEAPVKMDGPVYRIIVEFDRRAAENTLGKSAFQPGMSLTANIILERQSFLDWLLKPLHAVVRRNS